jgi:hypothetical protein
MEPLLDQLDKTMEVLSWQQGGAGNNIYSSNEALSKDPQCIQWYKNYVQQPGMQTRMQRYAAPECDQAADNRKSLQLCEVDSMAELENFRTASSGLMDRLSAKYRDLLPKESKTTRSTGSSSSATQAHVLSQAAPIPPKTAFNPGARGSQPDASPVPLSIPKALEKRRPCGAKVSEEQGVRLRDQGKGVSLIDERIKERHSFKKSPLSTKVPSIDTSKGMLVIDPKCIQSGDESLYQKYTESIQKFNSICDTLKQRQNWNMWDNTFWELPLEEAEVKVLMDKIKALYIFIVDEKQEGIEHGAVDADQEQPNSKKAKKQTEANKDSQRILQTNLNTYKEALEKVLQVCKKLETGRKILINVNELVNNFLKWHLSDKLVLNDPDTDNHEQKILRILTEDLVDKIMKAIDDLETKNDSSDEDPRPLFATCQKLEAFLQTKIIDRLRMYANESRPKQSIQSEQIMSMHSTLERLFSNPLSAKPVNRANWSNWLERDTIDVLRNLTELTQAASACQDGVKKTLSNMTTIQDIPQNTPDENLRIANRGILQKLRETLESPLFSSSLLEAKIAYIYRITPKIRMEKDRRLYSDLLAEIEELATAIKTTVQPIVDAQETKVPGAGQADTQSVNTGAVIRSSSASAQQTPASSGRSSGSHAAPQRASAPVPPPPVSSVSSRSKAAPVPPLALQKAKALQTAIAPEVVASPGRSSRSQAAPVPPPPVSSKVSRKSEERGSDQGKTLDLERTLESQNQNWWDLNRSQAFSEFQDADSEQLQTSRSPGVSSRSQAAPVTDTLGTEAGEGEMDTLNPLQTASAQQTPASSASRSRSQAAPVPPASQTEVEQEVSSAAASALAQQTAAQQAALAKIQQTEAQLKKRQQRQWALPD